VRIVVEKRFPLLSIQQACRRDLAPQVLDAILAGVFVERLRERIE
jgi:hypothetical protein